MLPGRIEKISCKQFRILVNKRVLPIEPFGHLQILMETLLSVLGLIFVLLLGLVV